VEITVETIKALREEMGAGVMDAKKALEEAQGNLDKAREILRERGVASAVKKAGRSANEGLVEAYIHGEGRVGVMVEVNCETDFVARTDDFKELAHNLAMQVAAMSPKYVDEADIPEDETGDPAEVALMSQPYIKDASLSIEDVVLDAAGRLGENIKIKRFTRFALGE
jgi:elongation factor Ts